MSLAPYSPLSTADELIARFGEPDWGPIAQSVYDRTYSRTRADGTKERWADTVARVVEGNTLGFNLDEGEYEDLLEAIYLRKVVPAGRHLWSTGAASGVKATANCFVAPWDDQRLAKHFCWTFDHLLIGGGVGANYSAEVRSRASVDGVPSISFVVDPGHADIQALSDEEVYLSWIAEEKHTFRIHDSREGWVEALRLLISSSQHGTHENIIFDVSEVRPYGAPIRGFGGTASGPVPLVRMLREVREVLFEASGRRLTALECMEIDHSIAQCVVAGNVRRSARMSIVMWDDPEVMAFVKCKQTGKSHWSTNISVGVDQAFMSAVEKGSPRAEGLWDAIVDGMLHNGEPGICNLGLINNNRPRHEWTMWCTNPCSEATLEEAEACVLSQVNLAAFPPGSFHEMMDAFRLCARFTLRATERTFLDDQEREVNRRNRRIGVGFMGLQDYAVARGIRYSEIPDNEQMRDMLIEAWIAVANAATRLAHEMCWPVPVSFTAVAPTGTISMLAGCSSGCETVPFPYYWRLVRHANGSPELFTATKVMGLRSEPCLYSPGTTVVYHPSVAPTVERAVDPSLVEGALDLTPEQHMRVLACVQEWFSDQSVSKTINLPEAGQTDPCTFSAYLWEYLPKLKGITAFPAASMDQSPYIQASAEEVGAGANIEPIEAECRGASCPVR